MAQNKSKNENKRYLIIIVSAIVIVSVVLVVRFSDDIFSAPSPYPGVGKLGSEHVHAEFKVYIETHQINFNFDAHPEYKKASEYIFLENNDHIIHRFATGATLGMFFESLGMKFTSSCFILDKPLLNNTEYCNNGDHTLKFYVNEEPNYEYGKYVIMEGDRILISYGNQSEKAIKGQLNSVGAVPVPYMGLP